MDGRLKRFKVGQTRQIGSSEPLAKGIALLRCVKLGLSQFDVSNCANHQGYYKAQMRQTGSNGPLTKVIALIKFITLGQMSFSPRVLHCSDASNWTKWACHQGFCLAQTLKTGLAADMSNVN